MKKRAPVKPVPLRAAYRAHLLIHGLLMELQRGVKDPELRGTQEWKSLFEKQSAVMNLHRLVQALSSLRAAEIRDAKEAKADEAPQEEAQDLSSAEVALILEWLSG